MNGPTYNPPITDWTDSWDQEDHDHFCDWGCTGESEHDETVRDAQADARSEYGI